MAKSNDAVSVDVLNVPTEYRLLQLGIELENSIHVENCIKEIRWIDYNPDKPTRTVRIVTDSKHAEMLIKEAIFSIDHQDSSCVLLLTKARRNPTEPDSTRDSRVEVLPSCSTNIESQSKMKPSMTEIGDSHSISSDSEQSNQSETEEDLRTTQDEHTPAAPLVAFEKVIENSGPERILEYVNKSSSIMKQFQAHWKDFAHVTVSVDHDNPNSLLLVFNPKIKNETKMMEQDQFESECMVLLLSFVSNFSSRTYEDTVDLLQTFKEKHNIESKGLWQIDNKIYECFFIWYFGDDCGLVTVTGKNFAVQYIIEQLQLEHEQVLSNQYSSSKKQEPETDTSDIDIHQVRTWSDLLEEESQLFSQYSKSCVSVQNLPPDCTFEEVRSFFEKKSVSKCGKVHRIIRLHEGYLIAFEEKKSAAAVENVAEDILLRDESLTVSLKRVPPPDNRLLYIEGKGLSKAVAFDLLRSLSQLKSNFEIVESSRSKKCLVVFELSCDTHEIAKEILKHGTFKVKRFCYSDCLLVSNVSLDVSDDRIILVFMNKSYNITHIHRHPSKPEALLHFSDYRDVRKILENEPIYIDNIHLELQYYVPGFGRLSSEQYQLLQKAGKKGSKLSKSSAQLEPCFLQFPVNDSVLTLFMECQTLTTIVNEKLIGVAQVKFQQSMESRPKLEGMFTPAKNLRDGSMSQTRFDERCNEEASDVISSLITKDVYDFTDGAVQRLKQISFDRKKNASVIENQKFQLLVKWKDEVYTNVASVTGTVAHINYLKEMYEEMHDFFTSSKSDYQILNDCGIVADVEKQHFVEINKCEGVSHNLYIRGTKYDIEAAKKALKTELRDIELTQRFRLQKVQEQFLLDFSSQTNDEIEQKINEVFSENNLKASFRLQNMALHYKPESLQECQRLLQELIVVERYPIQADFYEVKNSLGWTEAESFINFSGCLKLYEKNESLTLVGLQPKFSEAQNIIKAQLSQSEEKEEVIEMEEIKTKFVTTFASETGISKSLADVEMVPKPDGLHLQGKQRHLTTVVAEINEIVQALKVTSHPIEESWQIKFLKSPEGEQFLEIQQQEKQCLIVIENETKLVKEERVSKQPDHQQMMTTISHSPSQPLMAYPEVQIPGTRITIKLVKGDITNHQADAIVNASNEELELRAAGVSGSILTKGGYSIQKEMSIERSKLQTRKLATGNAVTTNAGNLPLCRKIIHVSGPVSYDHSPTSFAQHLKMSVISCLMEAEKHQLSSIAIPAISCGVFGGKSDLSAQLIVEAVVQFYTMKQRSFVKRIDLIEISNNEIINAFSKHLRHIPAAIVAETSTSQPPFQSTPNMFNEMPPLSHQDTANQKPACKVIVENGDILSENTDVIVNTAGPSFDLEASELSRKLIKMAGSGIVKECKNAKQTSQSFKLTRSGNLSCRFVAHLVVDSNELSESLRTNLFVLLKAMDDFEQQSIAIPAIGTGAAASNPSDAVDAMKIAIDMFQRTKPRHLKTIKIVLFQNHLYPYFEHLATGNIALPEPSLPIVFSEQLPSPGPTQNPVLRVVTARQRETMTLKICSMDEKTNEELYDKIGWKFEAKYVEKPVANIPPEFSIDDLPASLRHDSDTIIKIEKGFHGQTIKISGLQDDVMQVRKKIEQCLKSKKARK